MRLFGNKQIVDHVSLIPNFLLVINILQILRILCQLKIYNIFGFFISVGVASYKTMYNTVRCNSFLLEPNIFIFVAKQQTKSLKLKHFYVRAET